MMPAAFAANANLFVSAENSQFDNYMSGPQVIEVVVIDSDINETNESKGEPDVTVNGKVLRMVQAVDGNWYGYFADRNMALLADATAAATAAAPSVGLDFGTFCAANSAILGATFSTSETSGIAVPDTTGDDGNTGAALFGSNVATVCGGPTAPDATLMNVVREQKAVNTNVPVQVTNPSGFNSAEWPFIQLYTLNPTGNVVVQYNKGGGSQTTTLTFDTVDQFAGAGLDRAVYPQGAQVHATITDLWLNIDPTDEDSWTFATMGNGAAGTTHYQIFDENGSIVGDTPTNVGNGLTNALDSLMCEDNCSLLTNADVQKKGFVIDLQDNGDSEIFDDTPATQNPLDWSVGVTAGGSLDGLVPVTISEQGPNTGVFGTYDEGDNSNIVITDNAKRGTSASITYNEDSVSILVGLSFASVDIKPTDDTLDEFNSAL